MKQKLFINGEWFEAKNSVTLISPFSGEAIAEIPAATEDEVELAIAAAYEARDVMANMPAHQRAAILEKLVFLMQTRAEEAARIIALEAAKPISTAKTEVARTIQTYKFAAEEAKRIHGETLPLDAAPGGENRLAYTVREPLGVIGAITPFNFPMNLVAHKVGPAIAAGNTIVLKPAAQTPLSAFFLAELLQEAGLPAGALNVVTGSGSVVGEKIVTDDRVQMVTFTGSPSVGIGIRNKAGLKRVTLELGSNAAVIVDQGVNLDKIIHRCVQGAFSFQGQVCISLQRVYAHESIYEEFVAKFVAAASQLKIGDPLDPQTDVSAMISPSDAQRSLAWIEEAKQHGAKVVVGRRAEGSVLYPTVLLDVDPAQKVSCQEVFAPIVLINKIGSVEEGIALVNDSRYGLQAGIYTDSVQTALHAAEKLHVGGVMINDIPTFRVDHMPYGGVKESGTGREGVKYAVEEMTEMKLVVWNRNERREPIMQYPLSPDVKPEFCTTGSFMRLPSSREGAKIAIVGLPFDTAASFRVGARFAPQAIRQASMLLFPYHPIHKVYPFEDTNAIDIGDVSVIPHNIHRSYEIIHASMLDLMKKGIVPIGLGGDHSVTLATLRAAAEVYGPVAMIQFDSHTDTWDTYYEEKYWHGSPFIRAHEEGLLQPDKVFQIGIRGTLNHPGDLDASLELGYNVITTPELKKRGIEDVVQQVKATIGDTPVLLTFDIDFVDPAFAPGTGTPEVGGCTSHETLEIIRSLTDLNYIGFDLVEVLPPYDPAQTTSLLAATLIHDFAALVAKKVRTHGT